MGAEGYSEGSDEINREVDNDQDESIQVKISIPKPHPFFFIISLAYRDTKII